MAQIDHELERLWACNMDASFEQIEPHLSGRLKRLLVELGWQHFQHQQKSAQRRLLKYAPLQRRALISSDKLIGESRRLLLRLYTVGGTPLGECTRDKLLTAAKNERRRGEGHIRSAMFNERLAEKLKGREKVKDLPDDVLENARVAAFERAI